MHLLTAFRIAGVTGQSSLGRQLPIIVCIMQDGASEWILRCNLQGRYKDFLQRPCSAVFMAVLCNRAGHYIFALWFLLSIYLFFIPRLISAVADWCLPYLHTWCGLNANLGCRSETCCMRLAENTGRKNRQKCAICAPSHNFVGLCLRN